MKKVPDKIYADMAGSDCFREVNELIECVKELQEIVKKLRRSPQ